MEQESRKGSDLDKQFQTLNLNISETFALYHTSTHIHLSLTNFEHGISQYKPKKVNRKDPVKFITMH